VVLEKVLSLVHDALARDGVSWAVVGSAATALQGCEIVPRDLDLLAAQPDGVLRFAELMAPYTPATVAEPADHDHWRSSQACPLSVGPDDYGFTWWFGRWVVAGCKVEMAHIAPPPGHPTSGEDAGIWEAGPEIWPYIREVPFGGVQVPVVPLEIQLETCLRRGLAERVAEIVRVFRRAGYDRRLVEAALSREHLGWFEGLLWRTRLDSDPEAPIQ
jgi:hypothetical protein